MSDLEILMTKFENIKNRGVLKGGFECSATNETCGDTLKFYLDVDKDKKIVKDAKFQGLGCALSQVTAEEVAKYIKGKSFEEIENLDFDKLVKLIEVQPTPGRVKCIVTSLNAIKKLVKEQSS